MPSCSYLFASANYLQIPVNRAWNCRSMGDYHARDGPMCVDGNKGGQPNYEPNSVPGAPRQDASVSGSRSTLVSGEVGNFPQEHPNSVSSVCKLVKFDCSSRPVCGYSLILYHKKLPGAYLRKEET